MTVASSVLPSYTATEALASAVPVIVGVVSMVFCAATVGAAGASVSTTGSGVLSMLAMAPLLAV